MPRDSHLLPDVSQQLLRAARAGRMYTPPNASKDKDDGKENTGEDDESAAKEATPKGFLARKWGFLPRHMEEAEPEYVAKRRKGLSSVHSSWGGIAGPLAQTGAMRKTKVRRYDGEGNAHIYEVLAPKDQRIEGEILPDDANQIVSLPAESMAAVAPGTVVEGVGVVNSDGLVVANDLLQPQQPLSRRKPPPIRKKKIKGPGRGHKKVVPVEGETSGTTIGLGTPGSAVNLLGNAGHNVGDEAVNSSVASGDTPMLDVNEGDEDDDMTDKDDEDGEIEDDEGENEERSELAQAPVDGQKSEAQDDESGAPVEVANDLHSQLPTESGPIQNTDDHLPSIGLPGLMESQSAEPHDQRAQEELSTMPQVPLNTEVGSNSPATADVPMEIDSVSPEEPEPIDTIQPSAPVEPIISPRENAPAEAINTAKAPESARSPSPVEVFVVPAISSIVEANSTEEKELPAEETPPHEEGISRAVDEALSNYEAEAPLAGPGAKMDEATTDEPQIFSAEKEASPPVALPGLSVPLQQPEVEVAVVVAAKSPPPESAAPASADLFGSLEQHLETPAPPAAETEAAAKDESEPEPASPQVPHPEDPMVE